MKHISCNKIKQIMFPECEILHMQILNILMIFMKRYFLFHQNFDKLLCNLLLSWSPQFLYFLSPVITFICPLLCYFFVISSHVITFICPLLCLLNHSLLFSKTHLSSLGLLIAKLHKTGKKIGSRKFYLVVFLLHVSKVPNVQCTITLYKHLQEEIMILI